MVWGEVVMESCTREEFFSKVFENLICPRDQNKLSGFECSKCGTKYDEVGGIFRFLPEISDKGKIQEKKRYDMLGNASCLDDVDPHDGFYQRKVLLNEARVSATIEAAHIGNNQLLLDVGCGSGVPTISLMKKKEVYAVGLDLSDGALSFFRRRATNQKLRKRILLFQADAENMPFATNLFDRVISFSSIEHVPNPHRFIEECVKVCRPGGYVSACTPNRTADTLRQLKPAILRLGSLISKRRTSLANMRTLPSSPYHKEFTDKELQVLFQKSALVDISTIFLVYLPTGIPHPLGTVMSMPPVACLESLVSKVPLINRFSSLLLVSGRKPK